MAKRGQITVFIIVGIVILVILALFLFIRGEKEIEMPEEIDTTSVKNFVSSCLAITGKEAAVYTGKLGGYYVVPEPYVVYENSLVPVYCDEGVNKTPAKERIEQEISAYVDNNLIACINDFSNFPGMKIEAGDISTKTTITQNGLLFELTYPLLINEKQSLDLFTKEVPIELGKIYSVVNEQIKDQVSAPESVCVECMVDYGLQNNLEFDLIDYGGNNIIIILKDMETEINGEPYKFIYAVKLTEES